MAATSRQLDGTTQQLTGLRTLDEAKQLCRSLIGRLPRMGHEVLIADDPESHRTYLANEAGHYRVWTYVVPTLDRIRREHL